MGLKKKMRTAQFFQKQVDEEVARRVDEWLKNRKSLQEKQEKENDNLQKDKE